MLTKKDIVRSISEKLDLTQQKTKEIVQKTFDVIIEVLMEQGRIELRNFGVFEVKKRKARKARNPRTGEEVIAQEKCVVTFKAGKVMEETLQKLLTPKPKKSKRKSENKKSAVSGSSSD